MLNWSRAERWAGGATYTEGSRTSTAVKNEAVDADGEGGGEGEAERAVWWGGKVAAGVVSSELMAGAIFASRVDFRGVSFEFTNSRMLRLKGRYYLDFRLAMGRGGHGEKQWQKRWKGVGWRYRFKCRAVG